MKLIINRRFSVCIISFIILFIFISRLVDCFMSVFCRLDIIIIKLPKGAVHKGCHAEEGGGSDQV